MAIDDRRRTQVHPLRVATFRGDSQIAVLTPAGATHQAVIDATVTDLAARGVRRAITGALHAHEVGPFLDSGFTEVDRLHLLRHDLRRLPPVPELASDTFRCVRGRRRDRDRILPVDHRAFDDLWSLDRGGIDDAIAATASSRFRVLVEHRRGIVGYGIAGRSGTRGYLQRIAVDPALHRRGLGRYLVTDALRWLARGGAESALVNTQVTNDAAYSLYRACGFVAEPTGLTVLGMDLDRSAP